MNLILTEVGDAKPPFSIPLNISVIGRKSLALPIHPLFLGVSPFPLTHTYRVASELYRNIEIKRAHRCKKKNHFVKRSVHSICLLRGLRPSSLHEMVFFGKFCTFLYMIFQYGILPPFNFNASHVESQGAEDDCSC